MPRMRGLENRRIILFMPEQNRAYLRAYILHVQDLINASPDAEYTLDIKTLPQAITSFFKRGHQLYDDDTVLALQDYPSVDSDRFLRDLNKAHNLRMNVNMPLGKSWGGS